MSESALRREFNAGLKHKGHIDNIESHALSPGIPDIGFCIQGKEGHVELKFSDNDDAPLIRPTQANWFRARVDNGGRCFLLALLVQDDVKNYVLYHGSLVPKLCATKKASHWMIVPRLAMWKHKCDWAVLAKFLAT